MAAPTRGAERLFNIANKGRSYMGVRRPSVRSADQYLIVVDSSLSILDEDQREQMFVCKRRISGAG